MTRPIKRVHNLETDEVIDVEMTDEEIAEAAEKAAVLEQLRLEALAAEEAKAAAKAAAEAKLAALGLTAEEIAALGK